MSLIEILVVLIVVLLLLWAINTLLPLTGLPAQVRTVILVVVVVVAALWLLYRYVGEVP